MQLQNDIAIQILVIFNFFLVIFDPDLLRCTIQEIWGHLNNITNQLMGGTKNNITNHLMGAPKTTSQII
jgi:hypothetical protein